MSTKLIWTGIFFIIAALPALKAFGLNASDVVVLVGAIIFGIGLVMLWFDR